MIPAIADMPLIFCGQGLQEAIGFIGKRDENVWGNAGALIEMPGSVQCPDPVVQIGGKANPYQIGNHQVCSRNAYYFKPFNSKYNEDKQGKDQKEGSKGCLQAEENNTP